MDTKQKIIPCSRAEWDIPSCILIHKPGLEVIPGSLFPAGSLYLGPFDPFEAQKEHEAFTRRLQQELPATTIKDVPDIILENATGSLLENLRALAAARIPEYSNDVKS